MMINMGYLWRLFAQAITIFGAAAVVATVFFHAGDKPLSYSDAVSKALPSVVSVYGRDEHGAEISIGSGVIVGKEGYILTNYHLIANIEKIEISLQNGASYVAKLVGIDPDIDIAVLHVNASGLTAITAADNKALEPGDIVFAIGNPFGLNRSTTMGIVSAIGRDRLGLHGYERFIQTDAAINPGSSGGALANASGKLVGINSALFYREHGVTPQGIGFAIPAELAMNSYGRLVNTVLPEEGLPGAEIRRLSPRLRSEVLGNRSGTISYMLTARVWKNSLAARKGLQVGDIIMRINGDNPQRYIEDGKLLSSARQLEILRNGEELTLTF